LDLVVKVDCGVCGRYIAYAVSVGMKILVLYLLVVQG